MTAEGKGACYALWYSTPATTGARRARSLCEISPTTRITAATAQPLRVADETRFIDSGGTQVCCNARGAQARKDGEVGVQMKLMATTEAEQSAALSAALLDEDEAICKRGGQGGMKPLFALRQGGNDTDPDEGRVNVAVVSRCRPLLTREIRRGARVAMVCGSDNVTVLGKELPVNRSRKFGFDRVFGKKQITVSSSSRT